MTAREAVEAIWDDIVGRSGGDAFLETLPEDIQEEIKNSWRKIIDQTRADAIASDF